MLTAATVLVALVLSGGGAGSGDDDFGVPGLDTPDLAALRERPAELSIDATGSWVQRLNDELAEAGFHPDDGWVFGRGTRHAVYAFQKHHGLETTGVFTTEMWELLDVKPELPWRTEDDRVEVDLAKQVLYVVENNYVQHVLPVSSGNGELFVNYAGSTVRARTPEGRFAFRRVINGLHMSYLGAMYNPFYFYGAYAIHGSPSVPNYPASHGCIRVTNWDMDLLRQHLKVGEAVFVYGIRNDIPAGDVRPEPALPFL